MIANGSLASSGTLARCSLLGRLVCTSNAALPDFLLSSFKSLIKPNAKTGRQTTSTNSSGSFIATRF